MGRIKMKTFASRLHDWLSNLPIRNPVERRMAALVQVILLGFIVIVLIAALLNLVITPGLPWPAVLIPSSIFILIIGFPLALLRRGHFRGSVLVIIAIFFILETIAVTTASLREIAETLPFFTLTLVLAGLLLGRRALALTFAFSAGLILVTAFREQNAEVRTDSIVIASNFILLNGLMSLFLDQFGLTLRRALTAALAREGELQNEINVRKRAEEVLHENEQRLASIYDTVGDIIFYLAVEPNEQYRFSSFNPAFGRVTGLPSEQVIGRQVNEIIPVPSLNMVLGKYRQAIEEKAIVRWEETSDYPTGRLVGEVSIAPVFDEVGNCTHLVGTVHDITERKRAEDALRESEARYRLAARATNDVIWEWDSKTNELTWSENAQSIFGYMPEEIKAEAAWWDEHIHPKDHERVVNDINAFRESGGTIWADEYRFLRRDGSIAYIVDRAYAERDADGKPLRMIGAMSDITERKQAEDALRESEEKFKTLFNSANDAIFTMNHTTFLDCNATTEKIFRCSRDQIVGHSPVDFSPEQQPDGSFSGKSAAEKIEAAFAGEPQFFEWLHTHLDGTPFNAEVSLNRVSIGGEFILQAIVRDITGRKQAEEEIKKQLDELRRWHNATLGRESRILDLKREVNELLSQTGKPPRYPSAET
jgi:PAS domain S-box-containing protein